jgi:methionyl-tRNA formyltransferase
MKPLICVAGKNDNAVSALRYVLDHYPDHPVCCIPNAADPGEDSWQPSLARRAAEWGVRRAQLTDLYEVEDLVLLSLEFDTLIKTGRFRSRRLFNFHFSKLPKYRGVFTSAHPILNGETATAVTLHLIDDGIDTGDIIDSWDVEIGFEDTVRDLYLKNVEATKKLFLRNIAKLISGDYVARRQPLEGASYYSKKSIDYANLTIDLKRSAAEIHNQFRAFSFREFQMARYGDWSIARTVPTSDRSTRKPGQLVEETEGYFRISSIDNDVVLFKDYYPVLWMACESGDMGAAWLALRHIDAVDLRNPKGWTALIIAVFNGRMDIARLLLDRGADPDGVNYKGTTVLMYALSRYELHRDRAPFELIAAHAQRFDATDHTGKSVYDWIVEKGLIDLLDLLPTKAPLSPRRLAESR